MLGRTTLLSILLLLLGRVAAASDEPHHSPFDIAVSKGLAWVTDRTAGTLAIVDIESGAIRARVDLRGEPTGVALGPDGRRAYVAEYDAGSVAEIDTAKHVVLRRFEVGLRPMGVAFGARRGIVANTVTHDISVIDIASGKTTSIVAPREPYFVALSRDERVALVANLLPDGSPKDHDYGARVTMLRFDDDSPEGPPKRSRIGLPVGSTSVRKVVIDSASRWAYVAHTVGRFRTPATQISRGWVNTNAVSILDLEKGERYSTVLLDELERGATDPWGLAFSRDGSELWVTLRGTHQVAVLELDKLHELLARDSRRRVMLVNDLETLAGEGLVRRYSSGGRGPRGIAPSSDGAVFVVANYYSSDIALLDGVTGEVRQVIPLGPHREPDLARRGEALFHDATLSFQGWLSCSTCHPDRARNDGLTWDLLNDGLGTPQMTRSLVKSYRVAPTTARGARPDFESSVRAGFRFLQAVEDDERVAEIMAYLGSLEPERSPHLAPDGTLSPSQARGRDLFEGKARCSRCHKGEIRTDLKRHEIGTAADDEIGGSSFYTPKLLELYRTAPFLHDGRAADLRSIFTDHNSDGEHGRAAKLAPSELDDLVAFLLTL